MVTVQQVREQYPCPIPASATYGRDVDMHNLYCVGGAFMRAINRPDRFPAERDLGDHLRLYNDKLSDIRSFRLAVQITRANDSGNMKKAWALLEIAMTEDSNET